MVSVFIYNLLILVLSYALSLLLVFAIAKLLNKYRFNERPANKIIVCLLAACIFISLFWFYFVMRIVLHQIQELELGMPFEQQKHFSVLPSIIGGILFYVLIKKRDGRISAVVGNATENIDRLKPLGQYSLLGFFLLLAGAYVWHEGAEIDKRKAGKEPYDEVIAEVVQTVFSLGNKNANVQEKLDGLTLCKQVIKEANETMKKESQKTRRVFTDCEPNATGLPVAVLQLDYKAQAGKTYSDLRSELVGADLGSSQHNGLCRFGDLLKIFDVRAELLYEGVFKTATTVTHRGCSQKSAGAEQDIQPHLTPRGKEMIKTLVAIDTLGVKQFVALMADSVNKRSGEKMDPNLVIHSASSTTDDLIYVYKFLVPKASMKQQKISEAARDVMIESCNDDTIKLLVSHYNVAHSKRFLDSVENLVFEVKATRETCRRLWR